MRPGEQGLCLPGGEFFEPFAQDGHGGAGQPTSAYWHSRTQFADRGFAAVGLVAQVVDVAVDGLPGAAGPFAGAAGAQRRRRGGCGRGCWRSSRCPGRRTCCCRGRRGGRGARRRRAGPGRRPGRWRGGRWRSAVPARLRGTVPGSGRWRCRLPGRGWCSGCRRAGGASGARAGGPGRGARAGGARAGGPGPVVLGSSCPGVPGPAGAGSPVASRQASRRAIIWSTTVMSGVPVTTGWMVASHAATSASWPAR